MKKALIIFFVGLAVAGAVTLVFARPPSRNPATDSAQSLAPDPLSARAQVIDGSSAKPTQVAIVVFGPRYGSSPRIIHVPQGSEQDSRVGADERDEAVAPIEDDNADAVPPPSRYRVIPLPRRSDAVAPQRQAATPAPQRRSDIAPVPHHGDAPILQKLKVAPAARHQSGVAAQPQQQQQQSKIEPLSQRQDDAEPAEADARQSEDAAAPQVRSRMQSQAAPADAANSDDKLTPVYPTPRYDNKIEANDSGPSNRASVTADIPPPPVGYSPPSGLRDHPESKFGPSKK